MNAPKGERLSFVPHGSVERGKNHFHRKTSITGLCYVMYSIIVFYKETFPPGPDCSKGGCCYAPEKPLSTGKSGLVLLTPIHWIANYPTHSIVQP